jgi:hypothetical protein
MRVYQGLRARGSGDRRACEYVGANCSRKNPRCIQPSPQDTLWKSGQIFCKGCRPGPLQNAEERSPFLCVAHVVVLSRPRARSCDLEGDVIGHKGGCNFSPLSQSGDWGSPLSTDVVPVQHSYFLTILGRGYLPTQIHRRRPARPMCISVADHPAVHCLGRIVNMLTRRCLRGRFSWTVA